MSLFSKKGVYQSELVQVTSDGPIDVILTSHPQDSKFQGKPKWLGFKVAGNGGSEHQLHIENEAIEQALAAQPLNTVLSIQAHGSRDSATIEVGGATAQPPRQQSQTNGNSQPPQQSNGNGQTPVTHEYFHALTAAHAVTSKFLEDSGDAFIGATAGDRLEFVRNVATTFFIEHQRNPQRPLRGG